MNAKQLVGALLALGVGLAVYFLWPREKLSPEEEIRAVVAQAVAAAEKRDPAGVTKSLSEAFRGPGASSKTEAKQLLVGQFFRAQQIVVLNPFLDVKVTSPTTGSFKGTFLFGRDGAAPDATKYEIEAELERTDDGWQIVSATWQR